MRKQALQGILGFQKCFRGHQARRLFHELKEGVTILQSCNICVSLPLNVSFESNCLLL